MMKSVTYFIPGMGANEKMFYRQKHLPFNKSFLPWLDPFPGESLKNYARRYLPLIDQSVDVNLVGVSFGGILAQELAALVSINRLVLVSSPPSRDHLPFFLKAMRYVPLYKLIPAGNPPLNRKILSRMFGITTEKDLDFFIGMISDFNFRYIKWAIGQLVNWQQPVTDHRAVLIIGDKDRLFKVTDREKVCVIKGGTHYMIIDRADEINPILEQLINFS